MVRNRCNSYFSLWAIFCPFTPITAQKIKIKKKKWKKKTGDIIILHTCTINDNQMYSSWDTKCGRQNFLSFWTVFCPPLLIKKKTWRYYHFTQVSHKWQSNDAWFLRYWAWQTDLFVIMDHFCPFNPLITQNVKILKNWKKTLEILSFYTCVP